MGGDSTTRYEVIQRYFEPPKVAIGELKALTSDERKALAEECAKALNVKLDDDAPIARQVQ